MKCLDKGKCQNKCQAGFGNALFHLSKVLIFFPYASRKESCNLGLIVAKIHAVLSYFQLINFNLMLSVTFSQCRVNMRKCACSLANLYFK